MDQHTKRMPNLDKDDAIIRWGTATLSPDGTVRLRVAGTQEPLSLVLERAMVIGRLERERPLPVDLDLTPYGAAEKGVSRQHISLEIVRKTVMVTDLNSTNGTFLNEQRVLPNQRRVVRDNDEIRLGKLILHVYF